MLVYRIVHKKYAGSLFAGGLAGRWNGEGRKVLYTAENVALAYLETMYSRKGLGYNADFRIMVIGLPPDVQLAEVQMGDLPDGWRDFRNYEVCQRIGNKWFDEAGSLCLKVPSAVVSANYNVVINTLHVDYKNVTLVDVLDFVPDQRLEDLIRRHS